MVMSNLFDRKPIHRELTSWTPPPFDDAEDYCASLIKQYDEVVPFGKFNHIPLFADFVGYVICWDRIEEDDLFGRGTLDIALGPTVTQNIPVVVLGSILSSGTAILLDHRMRVWLYHTLNSVDPHLEGMESQAALIMNPGDIMSAETSLTFIEEYTKARVIIHDFEDI
jgi:hypothetical protein